MVLVESVEEGEAGSFPQLVSGVVSVTEDIPVITLTHGPREVTSCRSQWKLSAW